AGGQALDRRDQSAPVRFAGCCEGESHKSLQSFRCVEPNRSIVSDDDSGNKAQEVGRIPSGAPPVKDYRTMLDRNEMITLLPKRWNRSLIKPFCYQLVISRDFSDDSIFRRTQNRRFDGFFSNHFAWLDV